MNTFNANYKNQTNRIAVRPIACWLLGALLLCTLGLSFVYIKNQQYALGNLKKNLEINIAETGAKIEVANASISSLTSHSALQHRVDDGFMKLIPIEDSRIARLVTPVVEPVRHDGEIRTAANERRLQ
ncbi:MAG: hypothetical protein ABI443_10450 [Chthoniobacterales bacterium]